MAANLSKKFALLCCCLMTMQALRLVISTAGFCVVRFHIDCDLFNIFISRLVNAVMMSSLLGNWFGDLIVFAASGQLKIYSLTLANWLEFICFCTALFSICHTECGHLTGFYWSMVSAYFWWKVGEAPVVSIAAPDATDYYFAGFTLSGVWAACLKWIVMRCLVGDAKTLHFSSDSLGDVNLKVVGRRSVKTTTDYRAAKWLYIVVIVLTALMCLTWMLVAAVVNEAKTMPVFGGQQADGGVIVEKTANTGVAVVAGIAFGGVLSVPGAMVGVGVGWVFAKCFKCCVSAASYAKLTKRCQLIFGIVGAIGGFVAGAGPGVENEWQQPNQAWVDPSKWPGPGDDWTTTWAPMMGLVAGLATGALIGLCIGAVEGSKKRGTAAGAFIGSFFGLISGEIANAGLTAKATGEKLAISMIGIVIVVLGLGTVYSIYPGMAPCSITQFQYFNIIDILILVLSAIAPIVIMGLDLANNEKYTLGKTITKAFEPDPAGTTWLVVGLLLLIATIVCEILVLSIMQHPFSKLAQKVTTSGWRAVLLTVTMVTSQLVSTGVGFACVAAGGGFNDGINNVNSTLTLWSVECTGVLGEGYLTELKKYEPGKWPTQGMGKWATYWWWNRKAFGNAWRIWCCIGTTDLRRDIMLCRQ